MFLLFQAGLVRFPKPISNTCDIKLFVLLYSIYQQRYFGFIPNDQTAYIDQLREVVQQLKLSQIQREEQVSRNNTVLYITIL